MKFFTTLFVAAFAGLAHAQSQCLSAAEAIPSCGQACLTSAGSSQGCVYTDFACQCSHQSQINNAALTQCVLSACSNDVSTAFAVSSSAIALCNCVSSAGGGGGAATSAVPTAIPSTTNAISVTGAAPTQAANTAAGTTSAAAAGKSTAKVTMQTAAKSSSQPKFTGGAAQATGAIGGVLAGIIGLIAAL